MYSNYGRLFFITFVLIFSSGCSKKAPSASAAPLSTHDSQCFKGSAALVERYFSGKTNTTEVAGLWDCASEQLRKFTVETRGVNPGSYTAKELRDFLKNYFLEDTQITDRLLLEILELKRALIGGSGESVTVVEIQSIRQLMSVLKVQSIKMLPYLPLTAERYETQTKEYLHEAIATLVSANQEIGTALGSTASADPYLYAHLKTFLEELANTFGLDRQSGGMIYRFQDRIETFEAIKSIVLSPYDGINQSDWSLLPEVAARSYGLYLTYAWLDKNYGDWTVGQGRKNFVTFMDDVFEFVGDAVRRQPTGYIAFDEINRLVDTFKPSEIVMAGKTLPSFVNLKLTLVHVIQRMMGGVTLGPTGRDASGLGLVALAHVQEALVRWSDTQDYFEKRFTKGSTEGFGSFDVSERLKSKIQTLAYDTPVMFQDGDGEITIPPLAVTDQNLYNLSQLNWMYELSRLLIRGYSDPGRAKGQDGLTDCELNNWYLDFKELGLELKYFDRLNPTVAHKRFTEANLFTYASNGNELMDISEATQLLVFLISGQRQSDRFHFEIADICGRGPNDEFGYPQIDPDCFKKKLFENVDRYWDHLPKLRDYYKGLAPAEKTEFEGYLESVARRNGGTKKGKPNTDKIGQTDSQGYAMITQYLEEIFARFNQDQTGELNEKDAEAAFPIFKQFLSQVTGKTSDSDLELAFTYLLTRGSVPNDNFWDTLTKKAPFFIGHEFGKFVQFLKGIFKRDPDHSKEPPFQADRMRILQIFSVIAEKSPAVSSNSCQ